MNKENPNFTLLDIVAHFVINLAAVHPDPILDTKARLQFLRFQVPISEMSLAEQDVIIRRLSYILTLHTDDLVSYLGIAVLSFNDLLNVTLYQLLNANTPPSWKPCIHNRHLDGVRVLQYEWSGKFDEVVTTEAAEFYQHRRAYLNNAKATAECELPYHTFDAETIARLSQFTPSSRIHLQESDSPTPALTQSAIMVRGNFPDINPDLFNMPMGGSVPDDTDF